MSVAISEARKELSALAKQMRALMALDDELAKVGGLDQMIAERETRVRDLDAQIRSSSSTFGDMEDKIAQIRESMENEKKQHQAILGEAKREAESIRAKARDEALEVIRGANVKADRIIQDADAVRVAIENKVSEMENRLKQFHDEMVDAEKRRDAINNELARLRQLMSGN